MVPFNNAVQQLFNIFAFNNCILTQTTHRKGGTEDSRLRLRIPIWDLGPQYVKKETWDLHFLYFSLKAFPRIFFVV